MSASFAPGRVRHVTAHLLAAAPHAEAVPGRRVGFAADPADAARGLLGGGGWPPLRACAVATEAVGPPGGADGLAVHVDRVYFEPGGDLPEPWRPLVPAEALALPALPRPEELAWAPEPGSRARLSRFAGYALATDPRGRVLLTRIAPGFPGAGTWHPPGGATEHGEDLYAALHRELAEETGQRARLGPLLGVHHHYREGLPGPDGVPTDIHALWVLVRAHVDVPGPAAVVDADGSTDDAAWFLPEQLGSLELSETARRGLQALSAA